MIINITSCITYDNANDNVYILCTHPIYNNIPIRSTLVSVPWVMYIIHKSITFQ